MLADPSARGGAIIFPLRDLLFQPLFLQRRPKWTGGLRILEPPSLPWNDEDRPPNINFGQVDRAFHAAESLPVNYGLCALGVIATETKKFLNPQRPRPQSWMVKVPAVAKATPLAVVYQIGGQSRDSAGAILGNCVVGLYRTTPETFLEKVTSNGDGYFYFKAALSQRAHYIVAYKTGSPDVAGTTVNTLIAV